MILELASGGLWSVYSSGGLDENPETSFLPQQARVCVCVFIPQAYAFRCIAQPKISALIFLRPTLHSILINDTGLNETA
jgi:hypothetical protein